MDAKRGRTHASVNEKGNIELTHTAEKRKKDDDEDSWDDGLCRKLLSYLVGPRRNTYLYMYIYVYIYIYMYILVVPGGSGGQFCVDHSIVGSKQPKRKYGMPLACQSGCQWQQETAGAF